MSMSAAAIEKIIDHCGFSIISSIDAEGFPNTKAMLPPRKREGIRTFYFSTNTSSLRVSQYQKNANACLYFLDKRFFRGVMLVGRMRVRTDVKSKTMIWQEGDTLYYPKGVGDPDYCVLQFTTEKVRTYQNFKSETRKLAEMK